MQPFFRNVLLPKKVVYLIKFVWFWTESYHALIGPSDI